MYNIYSDYILQAASKILEKNFEMDVNNIRQHIFNKLTRSNLICILCMGYIS